jgi:hypothetical protein
LTLEVLYRISRDLDDLLLLPYGEVLPDQHTTAELVKAEK